MTTGITTFSTKNRKVAKPKPMPANVYTLTIPAQKWSIEKSDKKPDAVPYVAGYFEVEYEGTKRRIYTAFHNGMTPSKKDGQVMLDRASGLTAFAEAVGQPLEGDPAELVSSLTYTDAEGNTGEAEFLNPRVVIAYLEGLAGTTVRAKVGIDGTPDGQYGEKNVIKSYLPPATE